MQQLFEVRKEHGGVYVTVFEDGLLVPWKPLSLGDYIKYTQDSNRGLIPHAQLEDEIFVKCVQDDSVLRQMSFMKAGIIATVVSNIWQFSGPTGVNEFNDDLEAARHILLTDGVRALHELVQIITIAFPYKPEEVYEMPYETFLFRLAQSEKKLLELGLFLKEPISLQVPEDKDKRRKLGKIEQPKKPVIDAKRLWDQQQAKSPAQEKQPVKTEEKWWKTSPVLEATKEHGIDFTTEAAEQEVFGLTGHEKADADIDRASLVDDAQWIYADLLKELANRKKR